MECPECGAPLQISHSEYKSDPGNTEVYVELTMVCVNSAIDASTKQQVCSLYCGPDLNNPRQVAATVRNKVN